LCGESLATTRPLAREQALANPVRWRMFFDRGLERARVVPPRCDVRVDLAAIVEKIAARSSEGYCCAISSALADIAPRVGRSPRDRRTESWARDAAQGACVRERCLP